MQWGATEFLAREVDIGGYSKQVVALPLLNSDLPARALAADIPYDGHQSMNNEGKDLDYSMKKYYVSKFQHFAVMGLNFGNQVTIPVSSTCFPADPK